MFYLFRVFLPDQSNCDNDEDEWVSFDSVYVTADVGPRDSAVLLDNDEDRLPKIELNKIAIHKRFRAVVREADTNTLDTLFFLHEQELITPIDIELYGYDSEQSKNAAILLSSITFDAKIIRHSINFNDNYEFRFQIIGNVDLSDALDISIALGTAEKEPHAGPLPPLEKGGRSLVAAFPSVPDSAARSEIIDKDSEPRGSFSTRPWRKESGVRVRFWVEAGLAALCGFLGILTIFTRDWIEAVTGFDPDNHNGSFEWVIVAALFLVCLLLSIAARADWRRLTAAELGEI